MRDDMIMHNDKFAYLALFRPCKDPNTYRWYQSWVYPDFGLLVSVANQEKQNSQVNLNCDIATSLSMQHGTEKIATPAPIATRPKAVRFAEQLGIRIEVLVFDIIRVQDQLRADVAKIHVVCRWWVR